MRKIVIPYNGYIESKKVNGPVTFPYMESNKEILKMLARGVKVLEVLPNGERKELTVVDVTEVETAVEEHRKVEPKVVKSEPKVVVAPKQKQLSKKEKKKLKQEQNKKQELSFEIDILESK